MAEDTHFRANGYANAWYINPSDIGGKTEYTFVIEMSTQKIFYGSLAVSLATALVCLFFFVKYIRTS